MCAVLPFSMSANGRTILILLSFKYHFPGSKRIFQNLLSVSIRPCLWGITSPFGLMIKSIFAFGIFPNSFPVSRPLPKESFRMLNELTVLSLKSIFKVEEAMTSNEKIIKNNLRVF